MVQNNGFATGSFLSEADVLQHARNSERSKVVHVTVKLEVVLLLTVRPTATFNLNRAQRRLTHLAELI